MADQSKSHQSRPRLGRGLSSLIPTSVALGQVDDSYQPAGTGTGSSEPSGKTSAHLPSGPQEIPVDQIEANPFQPRKDFPDHELGELADSITRQGILQPLIVARSSDPASGCAYTLVAGERRLRAARRAGLHAVPCVVRTASGQQMLEWALVENIQRSDLNPVERADAYQQYIDRFGLTQADAAERLGKPRATVTNYLRLLDLAGDIQEMIRRGQLSFGHAKVLASISGSPDRQLALARKAAGGKISVRQLEQLVAAGPTGESPRSRKAPVKAPYIRDMEQQLTEAVGTQVSISPSKAKNAGRIVVDYYSLDDFDRIASRLGLRVSS